MKKTVFIKNAVILTLSSLLLRFAGIIFKVYITRIIGSVGIGLYQLVFSFYMLAGTFATTGICTAVTRLASEELSLGSKKGTLRILRRSMEITLLLAVISLFGVYFGAEFIAVRLLGDARAVLALRVLSFSLPFMGVSSCIRGYFIALRRVTPNAVTQILEQAARIIIVIFLVEKFAHKGLAYSCMAVLLGDTLAEVLSCLVLTLCCISSQKRLNSLKGREAPPYSVTKKLLGIAAPITSGKYLNTGLRTAENVLVPKNLARYQLSGSNALSQFGMIKGMALPILFFPSTLLNSVSTLLIPEMSEAMAKKQPLVIKGTALRVLRLTAFISYIFAGIFLFTGEQLGQLIYSSRDVGRLLVTLSPIVPFMYLDSVADGMLKGLDQQVFTFRTAVSDSVIRIILVLLVLPISGLKGFILIMYFSNALTCILNMCRLSRVSGAGLKIGSEILLPVTLTLLVCVATKWALCFLNITHNLLYVAAFFILSVVLYLFSLVSLGVTDFKEILQNFKL